jgi:hypothetical protein
MMENKMLNKYFVILPGFSALIETEKSYDDYVKDLTGLIRLDMPITFKLSAGNTCVFFPSSNQHCQLIVMTEKEFNNWRREQMFNAQAQAQGGIKI